MMNTSQPMSALTLWSETRFIQHIKNGVIFQEVTHISQSHMDWCTKSLWISKKRIAMSKEIRTKRLWSVQSPWTRHVTQQTKLLSKCQFISWYRILITKWAKHKHSLAAYFLHIRKLHWKLIDNQILVIHCGLKTKGRVSSFSVDWLSTGTRQKEYWKVHPFLGLCLKNKSPSCWSDPPSEVPLPIIYGWFLVHCLGFQVDCTSQLLSSVTTEITSQCDTLRSWAFEGDEWPGVT